MEQFPVNLDMYQTLVGFFLPLIIAMITRLCIKNKWGGGTKYWMSFVVVLIAAGIHVYLMGAWNPQDAASTILKILFLTVGSYLVFWRPSGINDKVEGGR